MQQLQNIEPTQPMFGREGKELAHVMQILSFDKLQSLMGVSGNLVKLKADRFVGLVRRMKSLRRLPLPAIFIKGWRR